MALLIVAFTVSNAYAVKGNVATQKIANELAIAMDDASLTTMTVNDFLAMSPKSYKAKTGKKMGIKNAIKLKMSQKAMKKAAGVKADIPKGLYIVGAILGWAWLLMGLMDDFGGNNWWVSLILYMLFFLPGMIHAFIKMKDYY